MTTTTFAEAPSVIMGRVSGRTAAVFGGILFIICLAAALSVDVVKTGFGLKGFSVFLVVLLFSAAACLYVFLAARSKPGAALAFTTAFIGASCVPVYMVFIAPEILHFSLVALAYFLWLYKEVSPEGGG